MPPSRQKNRCPDAYVAIDSAATIVATSGESRDPTLTSDGRCPSLGARYMKWRPSGRKLGHLCVVSPRATSRVVAGTGAPPVAEARTSGPLTEGANTITLSRFQAPPRPLGASAIVVG